MESDISEATDSNSDVNAALINSFCEITSSSKQEAVFFLESHNFDLDAAVSTFLDNNNTNNNVIINDTNVVTNHNDDNKDNVPILPSHSSSPSSPQSHSPEFSPSQSPSRSRSASPTPSRAPYELRSRRTLGKAPKRASGSRTRGIRTLADLKRRAHDDSDSDSDSDEPQEYYTGGEKRYAFILTL